MRDRTTKFCLIVLGCLLISSCSLRWSYNFLDWLVAWEVDEYVSLDPQQKKQLNNNVAQFHQWHRQTQLPLYAEFLKQLESQLLDQKVDSSSLMQSFNQARKFWQDSLVQFTAFAPSLLRDRSSALSRVKRGSTTFNCCASASPVVRRNFFRM